MVLATAVHKFHTDDLSYWPELRRLSPQFLAQVVRFYTFLESGRGLITLVWTREDRCFKFTVNTNLNFNSVEPQEVPELSGQNVVEVDEGRDHRMALTRDGRLFAWGKNQYGQLGTGDQRARDSPTLVASNIALVRCGFASFTLAITKRYHVLVWGLNDMAQLGTPTLGQFVLKPTLLNALRHVQVVDLQCRGRCCYALTSQGQIFMWGYSRFFKEAMTHALHRVILPDNFVVASMQVDIYNILWMVDARGRLERSTVDHWLNTRLLGPPLGCPNESLVRHFANPHSTLANSGFIILVTQSGTIYSRVLKPCDTLEKYIECNNKVYPTLPMNSIADLCVLLYQVYIRGIITIREVAHSHLTSFNNPVQCDTIIIYPSPFITYVNSESVKKELIKPILQWFLESPSMIAFCPNYYRPALFHFIQYLHTGTLHYNTLDYYPLIYFEMATATEEWDLAQQAVRVISGKIAQLYPHHITQLINFLRQQYSAKCPSDARYILRGKLPRDATFQHFLVRIIVKEFSRSPSNLN